MPEIQLSNNISTRLERIANLARQAPEMSFLTLANNIDLEWLHEAYRRTRKDGAKGIDGQSADEYAKDLEQRLQDLLDRAKSGRYRAPPIRRVYIPKANGEKRPLGIPTFEDKILQRAVAMVLEAVYEQDFLDCSYGFRPGRSAQQALDAFDQAALRTAGGWVERDVRKFFDSVSHEHFRQVLLHRVRQDAWPLWIQRSGGSERWLAESGPRDMKPSPPHDGAGFGSDCSPSDLVLPPSERAQAAPSHPNSLRCDSGRLPAPSSPCNGLSAQHSLSTLRQIAVINPRLPPRRWARLPHQRRRRH